VPIFAAVSGENAKRAVQAREPEPSNSLLLSPQLD
jgi:hypothetical protein